MRLFRGARAQNRLVKENSRTAQRLARRFLFKDRGFLCLGAQQAQASASGLALACALDVLGNPKTKEARTSESVFRGLSGDFPRQENLYPLSIFVPGRK